MLGLEVAYTSYQDILDDPQVDAVHITTPNKTHFEMARSALLAGKHVICEKPLAMNAQETGELVDVAKSRPNLIAATNYNIRFYPLMLHLREMIHAGELGEIYSVRGGYAQDWLLYDTDWNWRLVPEEGGDLRAIGRRGPRAWRIGIRAPRDTRILAAIETGGDDAVFTSGDYERYFDYQGRRYHHILDPRDGYPTQGLASVTVLHANAGLADAAATALLVAGPEAWPAMARALGVEAVMVVNADGTPEVTAAMQPRAWFVDEEERSRVRLRALP